MALEDTFDCTVTIYTRHNTVFIQCVPPATEPCISLIILTPMKIIIIIIIIIIGIQPLDRSGQRPELSQATGMALVRCILGKFLGVVCHCFPPLFRRSHFSPTRCLHVRYDVRDPSGGSGNCGRECCPVIFAKMTTSTPFRGSFACRKSTTWDRRLYFPYEGRRAEDFFRA